MMIQSFHVMDEPSHVYSIISVCQKMVQLRKYYWFFTKFCPLLYSLHGLNHSKKASSHSQVHPFWVNSRPPDLKTKTCLQYFEPCRAQNNEKPIKDFLAVLSTGGLKHICSSNQGNRIPLVNSSGTLPPKTNSKSPWELVAKGDKPFFLEQKA